MTFVHFRGLPTKGQGEFPSLKQYNLERRRWGKVEGVEMKGMGSGWSWQKYRDRWRQQPCPLAAPTSKILVPPMLRHRPPSHTRDGGWHLIMNSTRCMLSADKLHRISFVHNNIKFCMLTGLEQWTYWRMMLTVLVISTENESEKLSRQTLVNFVRTVHTDKWQCCLSDKLCNLTV